LKEISPGISAPVIFSCRAILDAKHRLIKARIGGSPTGLTVSAPYRLLSLNDGREEGMRAGRWAAGLILPLCVASAAAQPAADFYRGKRLTFIYAADPGSSYDIETRLLGRYLAKHLPGAPVLVVESMPAAGGIAALNYLSVNAPKDGTVIALVNRGNITLPLLGFAEAKFDASRLTWIGSRSGDSTLAIVWHSVPARSIEDMRRQKIVFGASGGGTDTNTLPRILNSTLGTKLETVAGYTGGNGMTLALERGEIEGRIWSLGGILASQPGWYREKKIVPLLQFALDERPGLAGVPLAQDLATDAASKQILRFFSARSELGLPILGPPGLPPERTAELRRAFDASMADPDFRAEAAKAQIELEPRSGERLAELVSLIYRTPAAIIDGAKAMLAKQGIQLQ
jgi:tripartite-type tricarboxylate transporter receptor subunit TctC